MKHCLKRFPDFPELLSRNFLMYTRRKPSGQTEESLTIGELKTHTTGRNLEDNFEEILKTNRKRRKFSSPTDWGEEWGGRERLIDFQLRSATLECEELVRLQTCVYLPSAPFDPPPSHPLSSVNSSSYIFIFVA